MPDIHKREWPKGYALYSYTDDPEDVHMQYMNDLAILMRINWGKETVTIMNVKVVDSETEALAWFTIERRKVNAN